MKKSICFICLLIILVSVHSDSFSYTGSGTPLKYISSCEIDLNNDNEQDIALLVETVRGRELIVLIKTKTGYNALLIAQGKSNMFLSCHFGKSVKETAAGAGKKKGKIYKIPSGTYIQLTQPEASSIVFFWNGNKFQEVWTSD